jgi:hypothetical protein
MAYLWVLNQADGSKTLLDIAERAGMPYHVMLAAARALADVGLIADATKRADPRGQRQSGQARSLGEMSATGRGQAMANAGSSCRMPAAAAGA